jgi:hypothetical protein
VEKSNQVQHRSRSCLRELVFAVAIATAAAAPAHATPGFDGLWTVSIVTARGPCAAYRYPIRITGGVLYNGGDVFFALNGKVRRNGSLHASLSSGDQSAVATGRLSRSAGAGSWRGGGCAGTWQAARRE